ncbi:acyl carrier protein [Streptomyces sp. NBC_01235]|uniref:acyl carrier protein n=1 Tax=Streptomyces sp. NBC_01235 TaxID=2903788 RepID=UPI002E13FA76|nr:acyl carrier protein [Streptomyces sp. NBC_01235]
MTVQAIPDNPYFPGIYRRTADNACVVAVAPRSFMSVPEVRAVLSEVLATQPHRFVFTVLHSGEGLQDDTISDEVVATRKFHRMQSSEGPVESLLAERIHLTLPDAAVLSMTDDIKDLGGDSLLCLELSEAIADIWDVEIEPVDVFRVNSLAALAADIEAGR